MSTPNEPTGREPEREEEFTAAEVGAEGRLPDTGEPANPEDDVAERAPVAPDEQEPAGEDPGEPGDPDDDPAAAASRTAEAEEPAGADAARAGTPLADAGADEPDAAEPADDEDEEEHVSEAAGTAAAVTGVEKSAAAEARRAAPAETPRPRRKGARPAGDVPVVRAQARYVRSSARKARLVCDGIRGKSVQEARAILAYSPRAVARDWAKLLESAVANAEHNHELVGDDLRVLTVTADEGPTLKRFRPRAMGRATRIRKRTSHLTITLTPKGQQ